MNPTEFLVRLFAAFLIFVYVVLVWALGPFLSGAHLPDPESGEVQFSSFMLSAFTAHGIPPGEYTLVAWFTMRAFIGMALVSWVIIPAAQFFVDANFRPLQIAAVIACAGAVCFFFILSLLIQFVYYGGAF